MARLAGPAVLLALLCFLLTACGGQSVNAPALLAEARAAVEAKNNPINSLWPKPERVSAAITPESTAMFPSISGNVAFIALYRNYPDGETRFALSLAQGTRLGACVRSPNGKMEYKIISPLTVVGDLLRASFASIDELFASASATGASESESWSLRLGDSRAGIAKDKIVLLRQKNRGGGWFVNYIYDLDGRPLVFYSSAGQVVDWKLQFGPPGSKIVYSFKDNHRYWLINVEIMEVSP